MLTNRLGEVNYSNSGLKMKIIRYRSSEDIDVQFEDGTVVFNTYYACFKKGAIRKPENKVGKVKVANNGMKMKIIKYKNSSNLDVMFEDGTIVKGVRYHHFRSGSVRNPNIDIIRKRKP